MQLQNVRPSKLPTTTLSVGYLHDGFTVRKSKILSHLHGVVGVATEICGGEIRISAREWRTCYALECFAFLYSAQARSMMAWRVSMEGM